MLPVNLSCNDNILTCANVSGCGVTFANGEGWAGWVAWADWAGCVGSVGCVRVGDPSPARVRSKLDGSSLMRKDICRLKGELETTKLSL